MQDIIVLSQEDTDRLSRLLQAWESGRLNPYIPPDAKSNSAPLWLQMGYCNTAITAATISDGVTTCGSGTVQLYVIDDDDNLSYDARQQNSSDSPVDLPTVDVVNPTFAPYAPGAMVWLLRDVSSGQYMVVPFIPQVVQNCQIIYSDYSTQSSDAYNLIDVDATSGPITITFNGQETAATVIWFRRRDTPNYNSDGSVSNYVRIQTADGPDGSIDGFGYYVPLNAQYQVVMMVADPVANKVYCMGQNTQPFVVNTTNQVTSGYPTTYYPVCGFAIDESTGLHVNSEYEVSANTPLPIKNVPYSASYDSDTNTWTGQSGVTLSTGATGIQTALGWKQNIGWLIMGDKYGAIATYDATASGGLTVEGMGFFGAGGNGYLGMLQLIGGTTPEWVYPYFYFEQSNDDDVPSYIDLQGGVYKCQGEQGQTGGDGVGNYFTGGICTTIGSDGAIITIGTTPVSGGSSGGLLYNDSSTVGNTSGGDVTVSAGATVVSGLQGNPVSATTPTSDQLLSFSSGSWTPTNLSSLLDSLGGITGSF